MTSFLNFHAFAASRGEGLRPELRLLLERAATDPFSGLAIRHDGMLQSGPDPVSEVVPERLNVSLFPQAPTRPNTPNRNAGPAAQTCRKPTA
jgi:hypothetical protein